MLSRLLIGYLVPPAAPPGKTHLYSMTGQSLCSEHNPFRVPLPEARRLLQCFPELAQRAWKAGSSTMVRAWLQSAGQAMQ